MTSWFHNGSQKGAGLRPHPHDRISPEGRSVSGGSRSQSDRGVALVITLLMLSVITFLAITFLVLSHRERGSVSTTTDQMTAQLGAEAALERAQVQLLASMLVSNNDQAGDLIVSTNFVNSAGFNPGPALPFDYRTNVNYDYKIGGAAFSSPTEWAQNIANLLYNPRPPVFMTNPVLQRTEFRYYLDLNRNGRFDTNGWQPVIGLDGLPIVTNGVTNFNFFVGDPEWIGILEHPEWPHSATNRFVARYAYLVVPASKTLDVNYIHNAAYLRVFGGGGAHYRRNQGVGTWEINLAAFLYDLDTNVLVGWGGPYLYSPLATMVAGNCFADAERVLAYRYINYGNLNSMAQLFGPAVSEIPFDGIDEYSDGPFQTGISLPPEVPGDLITTRWVGSDNPNHFFTTQDFFDTNKIQRVGPLGFVGRLQALGLNTNSYDRYTYYRMLAQLGTDSAPERNKLNLNYRNVTNGTIVAGMETNLYPWHPLEFFTNAAARMLAQLNLNDGYGRPITLNHIPIYPTNYYSPSIHRMLQLAANLYDATTNAPYPTIFRPVFVNQNTNVFISGYELVNGPTDLTTATQFLTIPIDLNDPSVRGEILPTPTRLNVYGVPWIIGARKGFPNLNEIAVQSLSSITRKLLVAKAPGATDLKDYHVTQMFVIGISNSVGVELWNSYQTNYPRALYAQAYGNAVVQLTNDTGLTRTLTFPLVGATNIPANGWPGTGWGPGRLKVQPNALSFVVPLLTNLSFLPPSEYDQNARAFVPVPANGQVNWNINTPDTFPQPRWGLTVTNRIRCMVAEGGPPPQGRVVDYVQLDGLNQTRDLSSEIQTPNNGLGINGIWSTNLVRYVVSGGMPMPQGVAQQLEISAGNQPTSDQDWINNVSGYAPGTKDAAIAGFAAFLGSGQSVGGSNSPAQAPFTPTAQRYQLFTWQANDPLIHYTLDDLTDLAAANVTYAVVPPNGVVPNVASNFWQMTRRYDPWDGAPGRSSKHQWDTSVKDPGMANSDYWDFPTNKLPNIGWIGRVHRGTPWQTVYLKASDPPLTNKASLTLWQQWTGNGRSWVAGSTTTADAFLNRPATDRVLFDLFTTALNDNATRGRLSVNQTNLAAWSAVLSGEFVLTNSAGGTNLSAMLIQPAGTYNPAAPPPLVQIVNGINKTRANTNAAAGQVFTNQVFAHIGDVLTAPQLTEKSPYLNFANFQSVTAGGINDEVMERIPQQTMSLLTLDHSPRFVIYAYGQTLKPADRSIVTSGPFFGLCTNYQVTAEAAIRAVVQVNGTPDLQYTNRVDAFGRQYPPRITVEQFNVLPPD